MTRKWLFGRIRRSESRGTVGYEAVMSATEGGRRTKERREKRTWCTARDNGGRLLSAVTTDRSNPVAAGRRSALAAGRMKTGIGLLYALCAHGKCQIMTGKREKWKKMTRKSIFVQNVKT